MRSTRRTLVKAVFAATAAAISMSVAVPTKAAAQTKEKP